jgi:DNA repair photolyase
MSKKKIPIAKIQVDEATYPREKLNDEAVGDYGRVMKEGAKLPPIVVFQDGKKYFLADGWHRLEGAKSFGAKEIEADVHEGSQRDAVQFALGANDKHGVRRTNADKRRAVEIVLDDEVWRQWSVNRIAKLCNVSWDLVEKTRKIYLLKLEDSLLVERGGKEYLQKKGKRQGKKKKSLTPVGGIVDMLDSVAEIKRGFREDNHPDAVEALNDVVDRLQRIVGKATGAKRVTKGLRVPLNVYEQSKKGGISETPEFEKKGLCNFAVNVGLICGHQCTYCSSGAMLRTHPTFADIQQTSFRKGYAIVDPDTLARISQNPPKLTKEDVVQLCTMDDAWSPEAQKHGLGRKCLEFLLEETPAQVRILTKNSAVTDDFDVIKKYRKRVIVGLSTGIPASREDAAEAVEPNASPVRDRLAALKKASRMGLRTYGMLCPCLPGVADGQEAIEEMFDAVLECNVEDIWLEPVNPRGSGLKLTSAALRDAGLEVDAEAVDTIRKEVNWSVYTTALIKTAIGVADSLGVLDKLHILLYPSDLRDEDKAKLKRCKRGKRCIIWL